MISKSDERLFARARQIALQSDYHREHVGCIAVYKGKIVGIGCNSEKTHPIQYYYNKYRNNNRNEYFVPKLHAEINCINSIRHLDINFQKVKLYIYRVLNDKPYGISRPCPSCMAAIKDFGLDPEWNFMQAPECECGCGEKCSIYLKNDDETLSF